MRTESSHVANGYVTLSDYQMVVNGLATGNGILRAELEAREADLESYRKDYSAAHAMVEHRYGPIHLVRGVERAMEDILAADRRNTELANELAKEKEAHKETLNTLEEAGVERRQLEGLVADQKKLILRLRRRKCRR